MQLYGVTLTDAANVVYTTLIRLYSSVKTALAAHIANAVPHSPTGSITMWAGNGATPPQGWLLCEGGVGLQSSYPALYAVLGSTWDTSVDPTTGIAQAPVAVGSFRVPNLKNAFLRGANTGTRALAAWEVQATNKGSLTSALSSGALTGTVTNGASTGSAAATSAPHTHTLSQSTSIGSDFSSTVGPAGGMGGVTGPASDTSHTHSVATSLTSTAITGTVTNLTGTVGGGDTETRPPNIGIHYIIKY